MRYRFLIAVVVLIVMISGCELPEVSIPEFTMGNGLQVNKLEFKPAKLVGGQATLLTLNVQNMGSRDTERAYVYLYGLSNEWYGEGSSLIGDLSGGDLKKVDVGGLRAANEELKTAGEKKVVVWKLKSPKEELEGTEFTHKVFARVCYHYATDVLARVEVVGENEWLLMEQTGKYSQHPISVKQTAAPIQINIESMQPVVVDQDLSFQIKVSNVGGGYAFFAADKTCENAFDESTDSNADIGLVMNNIKFVFGGVEGTCTISGIDEATSSVWLSKGQDRKFSVICDGFSSDLPMKEINLQIQMTYDYYIDSEATAILVGVKGEGDTVPTTPTTPEQNIITVTECSGVLSLTEKVFENSNCVNNVNAQIDLTMPKTGGAVVLKIKNDGTETTVTNVQSGKILKLPKMGTSLVGKCKNSLNNMFNIGITQSLTPAGTKCNYAISFSVAAA